MVKSIPKMFFALLQRLTYAALLISVLLRVFEMPAVRAVGGVENANQRQGDCESVETDAGDQQRNQARCCCSGIVGNRGPEKMLLPNIDEAPVQLHRLADSSKPGVDHVLHRGHQKQRRHEIARVDVVSEVIDWS